MSTILLLTLFTGVYLVLGWLTLTIIYILKMKDTSPMLIVAFWPIVAVIEGLSLLCKWLDNAAKSLAGWDGKQHD